MTRQELMEILALDGAQEQIDAAIAAKELTELERDRIYDFLRAADKVAADKAFEMVMKDVVDAPVYENAKEEKSAWKELRVELAQQVKDLKNAKFQLDAEIEQCHNAAMSVLESYYGKDKIQQSIEEAASHLTGQEIENGANPTQIAIDTLLETAPDYVKDFYNHIHEDILNKEKDLDVKTKQHSALLLMHTEAKSMQAQANARIFAEATKPYRDALKHSWDSLSERVHTTTMHVKNLHQAKMQTNDLDFHPIKDTLNKIRLANAKSHIKEANHLQAKIDKEEKKIIDQANKISKKEFRKNTFLNKLDSWGKGVQTPVNAGPEQVKDVERAKQVLSESAMFSDKKMEVIQESLDKLRGLQNEEKQKATHILERVATDLRERREEVQTMAKNIATQERSGEFGNHLNGLNTIERNLQNGMDAAFIRASSLSEDLSKFMKENGFEDIIMEDRGR